MTEFFSGKGFEMRTDKLSLKALVVVLAVFFAASHAVAAAEEPITATPSAPTQPGGMPPGDLDKKLDESLWYISAGDLGRGLERLLQLKPAAQQHLPDDLRFIEKVAEAVAAEKAGDIPKADAALRVAAGMAKGGFQFEMSTMVGMRLVRDYLNNGKKAEAESLSVFVDTDCVRKSMTFGPYLYVARHHNKTGNTQKAEDALRRAAPLAKSKARWVQWSYAIRDLLDTAMRAGEGAAAYGRLWTLVDTDEAREIVLRRLLRTAHERFTETRYSMARALLSAVKSDAVAIPQLNSALQLVEQMAQAHARTVAGDYAGMLAALRRTRELSKGKAYETKNVSRFAYHLTTEPIRGKPADVEKQLGQLKTPPQDVAALKYQIASQYARHGQIDDAYRVFKEAETLAQALPDAARDRLIHRWFYSYKKTSVRSALPTLLERLIRDTKDRTPTDRVVKSYCKAAAAGARGEEAFKILDETKARPRHYLWLAQQLRNYGDLTGARRALAEIHRSALKSDAELAKAVDGFWPSQEERTRAKIARCQGLISTYENRARKAKARGDAALAQKCENRLRSLRQELAAFEKEAHR